MEVAVVSHSEEAQAVDFEELYDEYLRLFNWTLMFQNKSSEAMLAYVGQTEVKEKWNKLKNFLMAHRHKSWDDAYLSLERVYRSVVNRTDINCGKKYITKKRTTPQKASHHMQ